MALQADKHPNRTPFSGVLTRLDEPSDKSLLGSKKHKVIVTRDVAAAAIPSLIGMAVSFKNTWDGHDFRQKCGVITDAVIAGRDLLVRGYVYAKDFPEAVSFLSYHQGQMGMSYEMASCIVKDKEEDVWTMKRITFTGASILFKQKAAYRKTSFSLHDQNCPPPLHLHAAMSN